MKIEWMGHASFVITFESGKKLCTDPYESGSYGGSVGYAPINEQVDVVTISHSHEDHNCVKQLKGDFEVFKSVGTFESKGITINGISTYHDTSKGSQRGNNVVFKIEGDGLKIAHLGDLGHDLSEVEVSKLEGTDILLIPVGGHFTIDSKTAWTIVKKLNPKVVLPMHYKTEKLGFPIAGVAEFLSGTENVKHLDEYQVTKETLPQNLEVIVLKHKR